MFRSAAIGLLIAALGMTAAYGQDIIRPGDMPAAAPSAPENPAPGAYIVTFRSGTSKDARALAAVTAGGRVRHNYDSLAVAAVTLPNENAAAALRANPAVLKVTPEWTLRAAAKPANPGGGGKNDPPTLLAFDTQQLITVEVQRVGIPSAGSDGTDVGIALLDSGVDFNHPDLNPAPNAAATAFNAISPGASCQDDGGHGTHIAGMMAAQNNEIGIVGVAPAAKVYCVKVLNSSLAGTDSQIIAGIDWVLQNYNTVTPNIRIVNMSFGRLLGSNETLENSALRPWIQALYNAGVVVVASAGNNPNYEISQLVPAGFPEVISVSSTVGTHGIRTCFLLGLNLASVPADTASGFTTDGAGMTVAAPGEERSDIVNLGSSGCVGLEYGTLSTTLNTQGATRKLVPSLAEARGTSFSAGLVSGVVARVIQKALVPLSASPAHVEGMRTWLGTNADRVNIAPLDHPWAGVLYVYTFDNKREGVVQAPK